jgi:hypothetical protein
MPKIARTFIKTGLVYFLCALLLGIAAEIKSFHFASMAPLFWHLLMVGWITQIIFGVSMWMFPGRIRKEGFAPQPKAWLTYYFLNVGLVLRVISEPMLSYSSLGIWHILIVISAIIQLLSVIIYVLELWPRIQSKQNLREKRKQRRKQNSQ